MQESGRNLTVWFSEQLDPYYGQTITFKWDLTEEQIKLLESQNVGGVSFYGEGHLTSNQRIPLSMASEIIIPKNAWDQDQVNQLVDHLKAKSLHHIKIRKVEFACCSPNTLELIDPSLDLAETA